MADVTDAEMQRYGFDSAASVYALYENACRAAWRQTITESQTESAELGAAMAAVAATTPAAWIHSGASAQQIVTTDAANRPIAFPYSKLMVANDAVNQSAAVLVLSQARAAALGIPAERFVYIGAGAGARDRTLFTERDNFHHSPSIEAVLARTLRESGLSAADFDHLELYSCFPCVPKLARRALGIEAARAVTTIGGLTFFGGPGNNYMTHAMVGMVRALRRSGRHGLLFGNGDLVTKHHATVLSREAPGAMYPVDCDAQAEADARRGAVPERIEHHEGPARLETYTVIYGRDMEPRFGIAICLTPERRRFLARVPANDTATIDRLIGRNANWIEPIGQQGNARPGADGFTEWSTA